MKIMHCPLNGPRNISEFVYGGEVETHPDPHRCSLAEWTDFVLLENNTRGVVREWWVHAPTAFWFIAERNTVTDEIVRTYPATELFSARIDFPPPPAGDGGKDEP
ncbi:MAG: sarcosine oxidase subunit delta [Proteobacteria bacterium]|nr:sarcosine oxidase subunit delta [Pseudomonadota bacterium]